MKINVNDEKTVKNQLDEIQGKSRVNLLCSSEVKRLSVLAQDKLDESLPKNKQKGAKYIFCASGPWANSYKYSQGATRIEITKGSASWFITRIHRVDLWSKTPGVSCIVLSDAQRSVAADRYLKAHLQVDNQYDY
ncbi:hypothetical protein [Oceanisphaera ostreae]|uniref:Uncharacterized protein n=1 Tax=Oceanisphaera ostreae TaxID=914151 RepID=A0ABW3KFH3_9GAMM